MITVRRRTTDNGRPHQPFAVAIYSLRWIFFRDNLFWFLGGKLLEVGRKCQTRICSWFAIPVSQNGSLVARNLVFVPHPTLLSPFVSSHGSVTLSIPPRRWQSKTCYGWKVGQRPWCMPPRPTNQNETSRGMVGTLKEEITMEAFTRGGGP